MVSKRKKKYASGEGNQFYPRTKAMKKLQVSLNQFRRLCIIKGIYPREPRSRRRAQKGAPGIKILYHKKDIQFLMHEPIIWTLRDINVHNTKVARATAIRDHETRLRLQAKHPELKLDHIVKERYPTFIDAVRDLDDCLTLCFLFSTFPSMPRIPREHFDLCRRLTVEFLHAVIEAKALRKVFISIKGYYYQAEIKGQLITWIVPHHFCYEPQKRKEVDFKLMATFIEFYIVMLGFVNYRLYHSLNLYYPPKFTQFDNPTNAEKSLIDESTYVSERVAALNFPLSKTTNVEEEEVEIDCFADDNNPEQMEEARKEVESIKNLKVLFKGKKFYLNREVPREPLVFIIRCFGGEVSWEKQLFLGSTFEETDETITHQIVDRPCIDKQYISRYYVQPQWIFDSVNARQLLPVNKYFIGEVLPPHLSPFVDKDRDESYIPPEEKALYDPALLEKLHNKEVKEDDSDEDKSDDEKIASDKEDDDDDSSDGDNVMYEKDEAEVKIPAKEKLKKMTVKKGELTKEAPGEKKRQERQEYKLREKMVKNKHRKLYKSMIMGRMNRQKEAWLLGKKRKVHEEKVKEEKKINKKKSLEQVTKKVSKK